MRIPVLLLALLSALAPVFLRWNPAVAQTLRPTPQLPGSPRLGDEVAPAVLAALREDDLAKALNILERVSAGELDAADGTRVRLSAAAGALHRTLFPLSADEQYETLHAWSLPSMPGSVRVLTCLVPEVAPPMEFARALGQRPTKQSFAVSKIGDMSGMFCTGWMMIVAADEVGSLRTLITELETLVKAKTKHADFLLALARIRDTRTADADLIVTLNARVAPEAEEGTASLWNDAVLVAAAMQRPALGPVCEQIVERLNQHAFQQSPPETAAFLRRLRATVILRSRSPETDPITVLEQTPGSWITADDQAHDGMSRGSDRAYWLTHEEHIQRLSGPGDDLLLFRYPLTGTFELKGEVTALDQGVAGMTYGGLSFDATSELFTVRDVQRSHFEKRSWPFVAPRELRMFNRVNVRSTSETVTFLSNLHPGWSGPGVASAACPWLGLHASGVGRVYFRNLEIVGDPTIPREVRIADSADLRGWTAPYGDTLPTVAAPFPFAAASVPAASVPGAGAPVAIAPAAEKTDWFVADGILHGRIAEMPEPGSVLQSHLAYLRPLLEGERIRYEFFHDDGKTTVHPALGRLVFLMDAGGIRMHWLTDKDNEWTGLSADHAIVEPLHRRGPRSLPLKNADWNAVTLSLADGKVTVSLNGEDIYERPVDDVRNRHPGFYHDRNASAVQIRNVTLTGNWPEKLSPEQRQKLAALSGQ